MQCICTQPYVFIDRHAGKQAMVLGYLHNPQVKYLPGWQTCNRATIKGNLTQPGFQQTAEHAQYRGFARTIGSDDTGSSSLLHFQADAFEYIATVVSRINIL